MNIEEFKKGDVVTGMYTCDGSTWEVYTTKLGYESQMLQFIEDGFWLSSKGYIKVSGKKSNETIINSV